MQEPADSTFGGRRKEATLECRLQLETPRAALRQAAGLSDRKIRQLLAAGQRITQPLRALAAAHPGTPGFVAVLDDPGRFGRLACLAAALLGRAAGLAAAQSLGAKAQVAGGQAIRHDGFADAAHHTFDFLAAGSFGFLLEGFNLFDDLGVDVYKRQVQTSSTPISRRDKAGNTYQNRTLDDGSVHEVLKNFPSAASATAMLGPRARQVQWLDHVHYWVLSYELA